MGLRVSVIVLASLLSLTSLPMKCSKGKEFKNNIIKEQKNYVVYYSKVKDSNIHNISKYNMAIIEPTNVTFEQIDTLKQSNTLTYGYQSIFEVEPYHKEKVNLLSDKDYLYINGIKQFNEKYKCYYGDIKSQNYQDVLLDSIERNIIQQGFDGVFFDTLDDIEHFIDEPFREDLYEGYIEFFKLLKIKYPNLSIIQNRAFELYRFGSAEYLDGLMYEDLEYKKVETSKYYKNLVDELSQTAEQYGVVILALSHNDAIKNYNLAKELNWLYYFSPPDNNYLKFEDKIYDVNIK